jgi:hypothetical protein
MFRVVSGSPWETTAQVLAFGYNARGRTEVAPLQTTLQYRHPAAFAAFGKQARAGRIPPGSLWVWREAQPYLGFLVVRETAVGATRLRYVQAAALTLARDYALEGFTSLAIASLCPPGELPPIREALAYWLDPGRLDVTLFE